MSLSVVRFQFKGALIGSCGVFQALLRFEDGAQVGVVDGLLTINGYGLLDEIQGDVVVATLLGEDAE